MISEEEMDLLKETFEESYLEKMLKDKVLLSEGLEIAIDTFDNNIYFEEQFNESYRKDLIEEWEIKTEVFKKLKLKLA